MANDAIEGLKDNLDYHYDINDDIEWFKIGFISLEEALYELEVWKRAFPKHRYDAKYKCVVSIPNV